LIALIIHAHHLVASALGRARMQARSPVKTINRAR